MWFTRSPHSGWKHTTTRLATPCPSARVRAGRWCARSRCGRGHSSSRWWSARSSSTPKRAAGALPVQLYPRRLPRPPARRHQHRTREFALRASLLAALPAGSRNPAPIQLARLSRPRHHPRALGDRRLRPQSRAPRRRLHGGADRGADEGSPHGFDLGGTARGGNCRGGAAAKRAGYGCVARGGRADRGCACTRGTVLAAAGGGLRQRPGPRESGAGARARRGGRRRDRRQPGTAPAEHRLRHVRPTGHGRVERNRRPGGHATDGRRLPANPRSQRSAGHRSRDQLHTLPGIGRRPRRLRPAQYRRPGAAPSDQRPERPSPPDWPSRKASPRE